jgi:hypothetical protein
VVYCELWGCDEIVGCEISEGWLVGSNLWMDQFYQDTAALRTATWMDVQMYGWMYGCMYG